MKSIKNKLVSKCYNKWGIITTVTVQHAFQILHIGSDTFFIDRIQEQCPKPPGGHVWRCFTTHGLDMMKPIKLLQATGRLDDNGNRICQCLQVETSASDFRCVFQDCWFRVIHLRINTLLCYKTKSVHAWWQMIPWRQKLRDMALKVEYQLITHSHKAHTVQRYVTVFGCRNREVSDRCSKAVLLQGLKALSSTVSKIVSSKIQEGY